MLEGVEITLEPVDRNGASRHVVDLGAGNRLQTGLSQPRGEARMMT